jgi:transcription elongation factor Elf1
MLPPRKPKQARRDSRFRSQKHCTWLRKEFACAMCGSLSGVEVAHVRMGSGAGMGQKPDDWRAVPLCADCHRGDQHTKMGEPKFWEAYAKEHRQTVWQLIDALCAASPVRREIEQHRREQGNG